MTDFVIVVAALATLGAAPPAPAADAAARLPTVGFNTYRSFEACERQATTLVAPQGARLVCLPVEPIEGEMASAY